MLAAIRSFFASRKVLEVDTPILSHASPIDTHIEVMPVDLGNGERGYLHTSPEYAMKRLLADGIDDIYQLSHVYRLGEAGRLHNPEFTMIEWYRIGFTLKQLMDETLELICLFLGDVNAKIYTYAEAFQKFVGTDYRSATPAELLAIADQNHLPLPPDASSWDKDTHLHFLMGFLIEPRLEGLNLIHDFPGSQAALAKTALRGNELVAERFEIYFNGIELANGFHELTDPIEQKRRFVQANQERQKLGKPTLPIDKHFLAALEKGLPESCGVAVGFDRLLMLQMSKNTLADILPFDWSQI